jgi:hypothetical protein
MDIHNNIIHTITAYGYQLKDERPKKPRLIISCPKCQDSWELKLPPNVEVGVGSLLLLLNHMRRHDIP